MIHTSSRVVLLSYLISLHLCLLFFTHPWGQSLYPPLFIFLFLFGYSWSIKKYVAERHMPPYPRNSATYRRACKNARLGSLETILRLCKGGSRTILLASGLAFQLDFNERNVLSYARPLLPTRRGSFTNRVLCITRLLASARS